MTPTITRRIAVITGACGGMGQVSARLLGMEQDLVLTDVNKDKLESLAARLRDEGYNIAGLVSGDLQDDAVIDTLVVTQRTAGALGVLLHTAGLLPALADWQPILIVNVVATEKLLHAIEPSLTSGSVAVLIASMAGHIAAVRPELDALMADPLAEEFLENARILLEQVRIVDDPFGLKTVAYFASKREVIRMCERRAPAWAKRGARIVSISPGMIWTPMARKEAEDNAMSLAVVEATPVRRWGTAMDIANAVRFLASDAASFITGCDLRIDGGVSPAMNGPLH
jgi:NAD(P)-dependent dehydrogenase (short-subunit alcohol dehydrogenase family)